MKFDRLSTEFRHYTWYWFSKSTKRYGTYKKYSWGYISFFSNGYRSIGFSLPYRYTLFGIWFGVGEIIWKKK